jgi:hypothetical protein
VGLTYLSLWVVDDLRYELKLKVPRFVFLNRFSPGPESELRTKSHELRIDAAPCIIMFIPAMVKTTFRIKKSFFSSFNKSRLSLPEPEKLKVRNGK